MASYRVQSRSVQLKAGMNVTLAAVEVGKSRIHNAGLGLFVLSDVQKGDYIAEFGGPLVDHETALEMLQRGQDTHLCSLYPLESALNGRVTADFPLWWYVHKAVVASFINDPYGTTNRSNVRIVNVDVETGHHNPAGFYTMRRVFVRATKDLAAGSEVLLNYGTNYHNRHFLERE